MAVTCPHCRADIGQAKDPSEFPWEDGESKEMKCHACGGEIWVLALTAIRWETFGSEEEMEMR